MNTKHRGIRILALALLGGLGCGDLQTGEGETVTLATARMSQPRNGGVASGPSSRARISADGRYVVFSTTAHNLAPGDPNFGEAHPVLRDRTTDTLEMIAIDGHTGVLIPNAPAYDKQQMNVAVSGDGRYVAFEYWADLDEFSHAPYNLTRFVYVRDRLAGKTRVASQGGEFWNANYSFLGVPQFSFDANLHKSTLGGISRDGRWVVFTTRYPLLYQTDTSNGGTGAANQIEQVYLADMKNFDYPRVYLVSHRMGSEDGMNAAVPLEAFDPKEPRASVASFGNKVRVAFASAATNLVTQVSGHPDGSNSQIYLWEATLDPSTGQIPWDYNNNRIIGDSITLVSQVPDANNPGQVTIQDANPPGNGNEVNFRSPFLSADGRFLVFTGAWLYEDFKYYEPTGSYPLGPPLQRVIRRDLSQAASATSVVYVSPVEAPVPNGQGYYDPQASEGACYSPTISDDGRFVAFSSVASGLGAGTGSPRVFVRDVAGSTTAISVNNQGVKADLPAEVGNISGDGRYVVFESKASNLTVGDTNGVSDIFVRGPSK